MEKKNKKKLFAIIGGSVLAFVLTIALSVSITLAYFGDHVSDTATVTLGGTVEVGDALTMTETLTNVIPGQISEFDIQGTVKTSSEQYAAVALFVNITATGETDQQTALTNALAFAGTNWYKLTATEEIGGEIYAVYVYTTDTASEGDAKKLTSVHLGGTEATSLDLTLDGTFTADPEWTNTYADKTITVKATLAAVQYGGIDGAGVSTTDTYTYTELQPIFADVLAAAATTDTPVGP